VNAFSFFENFLSFSFLLLLFVNKETQKSFFFLKTLLTSGRVSTGSSYWWMIYPNTFQPLILFFWRLEGLTCLVSWTWMNVWSIGPYFSWLEVLFMTMNSLGFSGLNDDSKLFGSLLRKGISLYELFHPRGLLTLS